MTSKALRALSGPPNNGKPRSLRIGVKLGTIASISRRSLSAGQGLNAAGGDNWPAGRPARGRHG